MPFDLTGLPAQGSLQEQVRACLLARAQTPVITCLRRFGAPVDLCGNFLLANADKWNRRWSEMFGDGGHVFLLNLPPGDVFVEILITVVSLAMPKRGSKFQHLLHAAQDCAATALICTDAGFEISQQLLTPQGSSSPVCGVMSVEGSAVGIRPPVVQAASVEDAPAVIQYTSGSTQRPKGVRIMGGQILSNAALVARCWDMNVSTVMVNWLPHYHDMGLMGGILYPLLTGGRSVQMGPLDMIRKPASWLRAISDYQANFSGGPAFAFAECLRRVSDDECNGLDLSSWSRAYCGAEPIPAGLLSEFQKRFQHYGLERKSVFACYGMAEITLYAAGAPEDADEAVVPPPGCERIHPCRITEETQKLLKIVDPQTALEVPDGHAGEIWLTGGSKGQGYINLPNESRQTFEAVLEDAIEDRLWLRTGDLGVISADRLYITGRLKDILIANGRNVAAAELEWLAAGQDNALNPLAAAAFMPEPTISGEAVLLIELKAGATLAGDPDVTRASIERAIMGEWGVQLKDFKILPRGALKRTTSGKIRRQAVASAYREGRYDDLQVNLDVSFTA